MIGLTELISLPAAERAKKLAELDLDDLECMLGSLGTLPAVQSGTIRVMNAAIGYELINRLRLAGAAT
jgi:hypothetical protein